ncbi:helix-turn-helix transcriptional regulator [Rathayibacter sp. VKM Ac-2759]|uniref:helix-turn-helix domain-containing protein n=1 Tax=Rathayibacter sp. VKM Ac-2759 TaxID=2609252 RepID=UPI001FCA0E62|nr:helix-turn-helix transcriptional regulator [Rathayibacter sp. VKM Ac-2759]
MREKAERVMEESRTGLGRYLRARRDGLRPEDVGLEADAARRVAGLRRQEVAGLAGISHDYYLRLEQGRDHQPSAQVLLALARALRLDLDATSYLFRLAGQVPPPHGPSERHDEESRAAETTANVTTLMQHWTAAPAYVLDSNQDVVAVNALGRAFFPLPLVPGANMVVATVDAALAATEGRDAWDSVIRAHAAALRYSADPDHPRLRLLVASLSSRSKVFREAWASHEARPKRGGTAPVLVEPFGFIDFRWQTLDVPGGGLYLTTFFGEAGTPPAAAIDYLAAKLRVETELERASATRDAAPRPVPRQDHSAPTGHGCSACPHSASAPHRGLRSPGGDARTTTATGERP